MITTFRLQMHTADNLHFQSLEYKTCEIGLLPQHYKIEILPNVYIDVDNISINPDGYKQTIFCDHVYLNRESLFEDIKTLTECLGWVKV